MTPPTSADHRLTGCVAALVCVATLAAVCAAPAGAAVGDAPPSEPAAPPQPTVPEPDVEAAGAVLWDPAAQRVLWGHEAHVPRPMASLTKMLTALVLVERAERLDETVTVSATAAAVGQATVGLTAGQQVPLRSLVAGLMVESGNDAAVAVAEHVAGSEGAFVELMARRADELGADTAEFVNASGLTNDPAHRASPRDLAVIAAAAMDEPIIARFAAADAVIVDGLPPLVNRNELLGNLPGADGVKTGFTSAAGYSLAGSATRDDWRLIAVVLDSDDRAGDAAELLEWGFAAFDRVRVDEQGPFTWRRGTESTAVRADGGGAGATVPAATPAWWRRTVAPAVTGPVTAGATLGEAAVRIDGRAVATGRLSADTTIGQGQGADTAAGRVGDGLAEALRGLARGAGVETPASRRSGDSAVATD